MASTSRTTLHSLITRILSNPTRYEFVQVLRILESFDIINSPNTTTMHENIKSYPVSFSARFVNQNNLIFPTSVITKGIIKDEHVIVFTVPTFGLIGTIGTLPYSYSLLVGNENQKNNPALKSFIDIFQNRSVMLFYGASTKYRLVLSYERRTKQQGDNFRISIDSLNGLNSKYLQNRLNTNDDIVAFFTGFFSSRKPNAYGLENILHELLGFSVRFVPYRGYWFNIHEKEISSLQNIENVKCYNILGFDCIVGSKIWLSQNSFRLYIGPVPIDVFYKLLPKQPFYMAIKSVISLYCGDHYKFEIKIILDKQSVPMITLKNSQNIDESSMLGSNTWLLSSESPVARDDAVFIYD